MKFFAEICDKFCKESDKRKEEKSFFLWLSEHFHTNEYVLYLNGKLSEKLFFEAPFKIGNKPKKTRWYKDTAKPPSFILATKGRERESSFFTGENWRCVCDGFFFSLYENIERFKNFILPLRFGLSVEEKVVALRIARSVLEIFLKDGKLLNPTDFKDLSSRFLLRTDLDVTIWIGGKIRGSWVAEDKTLIEGIIEGISGAARDPRFKPLSSEESNGSRIEIILMSDFRLPLPRNFIKKNELLAEKGFQLKMSGKTGWFLPEVYNVRRFQNLNEFLGDLSQEKAGLPRNTWQNRESSIEVFEVEDFIEGDGYQKVRDLYGPTIVPLSADSVDGLEKRMRLAADWLVNIQEIDGNFPPIINPLTGSQTQIDWPRSAFCGWILAEFGETSNDGKYIKAAQRNTEYFRQYLDKILFLPIENALLAYAYAGQGVLALYRNSNDSDFYSFACRYAEKILHNSDKLNFEPITYTQIASFLLNLSIFDSRFFKEGQKFSHIVRKNFESNLKKKQLMNLAVWAELTNIFSKISKIKKNNQDVDYARKVADWLLSHQLESGPEKMFGPFPTMTNIQFVYTRGTGKIFEVLALYSEFKEKVEKAIAWLKSMQYTEENTFFVPSEIRPKIIGGFRHDYFNQEAWIDSAGHFILGGVRFLSQKRSPY